MTPDRRAPTGPDIAVLPGAGSFGGELRPLMQAFGPPAWLVCYPGRFGRGFGRPALSFDHVVRSCVDQVAARRSVRPVLVGHSFGAYVAFAAAAELERSATGPAAVVVVGAMPPHLFSVSESVTRSRAALAAYLDEMNPELPSSGEWREVVIDTAMSDLTLLREFDPVRCGPLRCTILAARGETDPLTTTAGLAEWGRSTHGDFAHRDFPGGHTDLLGNAAFLAWLRGEPSVRWDVSVHG
ncbi:thioesterase II family protein [Micromonospora rifamycinica]|uniref:Surfactin synthase thioesterase subunit n=1 Tax=Micromonospora rifamycinica TaxID=291594 RepID=A0A1C5GMA9_9ACTN|nr:alpha/beta fold hydrolase [Micromonospora rifamycinica]SCG34938.1 Surfactin synthase thioesterase subunit [Micromonospora rifamycinica]